MIFFKRKKKNNDTIDFTLFDKLRSNNENQIISNAKSKEIQNKNTEISNMAAFSSIFGNQENQEQRGYRENYERANYSNYNYSNTNFIEQKIMEIYEKLTSLENSIEEIKKAINKKE